MAATPEETASVRLALGRIFRLMSRPAQPGEGGSSWMSSNLRTLPTCTAGLVIEIGAPQETSKVFNQWPSRKVK